MEVLLDREKEHWVDGFISLSFIKLADDHRSSTITTTFPLDLKRFDRSFICIIITEHLFLLLQITMAGLTVIDRIVNFFVVNEGKQADLSLSLTAETKLFDQNA